MITTNEERQLVEAFQKGTPVCMNTHTGIQQAVTITNIEERDENEKPMFTVLCVDGEEKHFSGTHCLSIHPT